LRSFDAAASNALAVSSATVHIRPDVRKREEGPLSPSLRSPRSKTTAEWTRPYEKAAVAKSSRDEAEVKSAALNKSKQLLGALYDLRRTAPRAEDTVATPPVSPLPLARNSGEQGDVPPSRADGDEAAPPPTSSSPRESEEPLLYSTLRDTEDVEEALRRTEGILQAAQDPVREYGGVRHASTLISARSLAVVRRKADLCKISEARLAAFEARQNRQEEIQAEFISGGSPDIDDLVGVHKFVKAHTHRPGNPADANKSDFHSFVISFLLPNGHVSLTRLTDLATAATEHWAQAALGAARQGVDTRVVRKMVDLASAILGNERHPAIEECLKVIGNILAENALKNAEKIRNRDAAVVKNSAQAQPDSAKSAAEAINGEITSAVSMGAPSKHKALEAAKGIATELARAYLDRLALKVLQFAFATRDKDAATAAACGDSVPPVGPAERHAEAIEGQAAEVIRLGVPEAHKTLLEAAAVAKGLRAEDGERKRMAAREKRLAKQSEV
jgi:hypothetical protein